MKTRERETALLLSNVYIPYWALFEMQDINVIYSFSSLFFPISFEMRLFYRSESSHLVLSKFLASIYPWKQIWIWAMWLRGWICPYPFGVRHWRTVLNVPRIVPRVLWRLKNLWQQWRDCNCTYPWSCNTQIFCDFEDFLKRFKTVISQY